MRRGVEQDFAQQILRTDAAGMPLDWIGFREAVKLHCNDTIAYSCGNTLFEIHGGINAITRRQSIIQLHSIIATQGHSHAIQKMRTGYAPPLNNKTLFQRDAYLCMYCGEQFDNQQLSRDHITPVSRGGLNTWTNVVTACIRCNNHKAGRTPEQAGMGLLAIPFTPTHAEYVYLLGRNVLADQMEFLLAHFPRSSPLRRRTAH